MTFLPAVPREPRSPALYRSADVCLVPLRAVPLFRAFIPSKMFEILACGRPSSPRSRARPPAILRESGAAVVVPPEDVDALALAVRRLADDPATVRARWPRADGRTWPRTSTATRSASATSGSSTVCVVAAGDGTL